MARTCWQASSNNRYWMDVRLGNVELRVMIDLGLVDSRDELGFEVEPGVYDRLNRAGCLAHFRHRFHRGPAGQTVGRDSGMTIAQLVDSVSRQLVGPVTQL